MAPTNYLYDPDEVDMLLRIRDENQRRVRNLASAVFGTAPRTRNRKAS